jgi:hypothetical protein
MNNQRRKKIKDIHTRLSDTVEEIRMIATEEEEYRDAMPENLQGSEKYTNADDVAYKLNDTADSIENTLDQLDEAAE